MNKEEKTTQFWDIATPLLITGQAEKGTMMGFPCLRVYGQFCASLEKDTGDIIIKIPAARVQELIACGEAQPFAPNGRTFREWAQLTTTDPSKWETYLAEAITFVSTKKN